MVSYSPLEYRDIDVELEPLADPQTFEHPDSPLPLLDDSITTTTASSNARNMEGTPKWMRTAQPWGRTVAQKIIALLKPRLALGYIFWVLIVLYVLYCILARSPLLASKLPNYSGRYGVGVIDVEVPVQTPRKTSDLVFKDGKPAFELETVLFSLYYPTTKGVKSARPKHRWIPKPVGLTAEGYARAAHFNNFISRPIFTFALWALAGTITIPAEVDVPLLPLNEETKDKFPVVVLSHGQASSRTDYTHYCGELASSGVVVAAIEHRDGSGPGSIVTTANGERRVMYLNKKELEGGKGMEDDEFKFEQLAFRQAEIEETIAVLRSLEAGKGVEVYKTNARKEGKDLDQWENRLNFSQTVIAGHSLGATGALQVLRGATSEKNPAVGGIILDPGKSSGRLNADIDVPILVVHSDSWSKKVTVFFGRPHFDTVKDIVKDVLKRVGSSWFLTSLKTSHPSVTDAPLIEPLLLRWTTGAKIDVHDGLREYVRVSVEFLEFLKNGTRKGVLSEDVTHEEYGKDTMTEEQKRRIPEETTKFWQIHVAPPRVD
ncbi:paf-acetylhydrolase family member [Colletotrichum truncatum]|uniref:Paf-acetylhydrolase family member n=1 Tax=Colletotrichum truncatum TaxID=5467 RepID=A0ACC3YUP9_COLTU|nr:paf-acetylhydrolase family member [Colletotrichum truncatum]KAF6780887.1 paf-acetylhydrolase family member [Colletotrichum truncatum]